MADDETMPPEWDECPRPPPRPELDEHDVVTLTIVKLLQTVPPAAQVGAVRAAAEAVGVIWPEHPCCAPVPGKGEVFMRDDNETKPPERDAPRSAELAPTSAPSLGEIVAMTRAHAFPENSLHMEFATWMDRNFHDWRHTMHPMELHPIMMGWLGGFDVGTRYRKG